MIAYRLTGSRCRCATCGQHFNSLSTFDRHRVGGWMGNGVDRRCLTVDEMSLRGWSRNLCGFWIERKRIDATRTTSDRAIPVGEGRERRATVLYEAS